MEQQTIEALGDRLFTALKEGTTLSPFTATHPPIQIEDAYKISLHFLKRRQESGQKVIGKKIGVTSDAVQSMLGVYQPDFGFLTDDMIFPDQSEIKIDGLLIQPKAEGEIAFTLKSPLKGPGVTAQDVLDATQCIQPCFEIVDSRISNWQIKIQDTIADNASCGIFTLGQTKIDPREIDLETCGMILEKNGKIVSTGAGAAVQGSPLQAVAWLANTLGQYGVTLDAGDIILSGSWIPLEPVGPGDHIRLRIGSGIGEASLRFV